MVDADVQLFGSNWTDSKILAVFAFNIIALIAALIAFILGTCVSKWRWRQKRDYVVYIMLPITLLAYMAYLVLLLVSTGLSESGTFVTPYYFVIYIITDLFYTIFYLGIIAVIPRVLGQQIVQADSNVKLTFFKIGAIVVWLLLGALSVAAFALLAYFEVTSILYQLGEQNAYDSYYGSNEYAALYASGIARLQDSVKISFALDFLTLAYAIALLVFGLVKLGRHLNSAGNVLILFVILPAWAVSWIFDAAYNGVYIFSSSDESINSAYTADQVIFDIAYSAIFLSLGIIGFLARRRLKSGGGFDGFTAPEATQTYGGGGYNAYPNGYDTGAPKPAPAVNQQQQYIPQQQQQQVVATSYGASQPQYAQPQYSQQQYSQPQYAQPPIPNAYGPPNMSSPTASPPPQQQWQQTYPQPTSRPEYEVPGQQSRYYGQ